ncbi:B12-binding domain-containing radical SAM protein [Acidobacteriota bacterium]
MRDILFVNPPSPDKHIYIRDINRSGRRTREGMIWPQTNLAYLAAVMEKNGYKVDILDCIAERIKWGTFESMLKKKAPKYVVIEIISSTLTNDVHTATLAKALGCITIGVGPHVTDKPEETLESFSDLDYLIRGEAEITVLELIEALEKKEDISGIKGIALRHDHGVRVNEERPFIENLDELPFPLHNLLPLDKYHRPFFGRYTFVVVSRGCPYKCIFCRQIVMWKGKYRQRSADCVLDEIKQLKELGVQTILLHADTFTVKRDWVIDLCKKIVDADIKIRWACNTHAARIDREMVRWMKKAGCFMIAPGIETGSQEILDNIKKELTIEQIRSAVNIIHEEGIEVWGYFVFGLPGETRETIQETIKLSLELPLDLANFAIAAPYPGTEFLKMAEEKGWLVSTKWEDFDQNYSAIISYENLSNEEIMNAVRIANRKWFFRPKPMRKFVKEMFKDRKSFVTIAQIMFNHLRLIFGGM